MPPHDFAGKNILITGAGSGIGRACALLLAEAGAGVALLGRTADELNEVLEEIGGEAKGHLALLADVADEGQMKAAFEKLGHSFPQLHGVVANAGVNGVWAPLEEIEVEEWDATIGVNLRGAFLTLKLALPLLRDAGGSVVVVSSINGTRIFSNSGATAYSCSKAAQVALAKMTALELARHRIRVNVVCPGAIETSIDDSTERRHLDGLHLPVHFPKGDVPLTGGKPGNAEHVARTIGFLLGDDAAHISGSEIYVDGAQSLLQG